MINYLIKILLNSLLLTIIIEFIIALLLKVKDKLDLINVLLVNILTNPLLVSISLYINIKHSLLLKNILIIPLEIIVVLVEGFIYKKYLKYNKINPYLLSLILNGSSFLLGEVINKIIY
jgi:hypothetical protein